MMYPFVRVPSKGLVGSLLNLPLKPAELGLKWALSSAELAKASQTYLNGVFSYYFDFMAPYWVALNSFQRTEKKKLVKHQPQETARDYLELLHFNMEIARKGMLSTMRTMNQFHAREMQRRYSAWLNTLFDREGEDIAEHAERLSHLVKLLTVEYPKSIRDIEPAFGFHFDDGGYIKAAETDRFTLYQVLPWKKCTEVRPNGKPVLIIPPYVLGASILGFLPGENKSYTHCFANQGIPTYIRIMKDINETPAVQTMTGEDDCLDMKTFCEVIRERHGKPVTLNGFCQGGFVAALNLMSGELDGLVDAFITCVAPMDGTRSKALVEYLEHIPQRFRDLGYAAKTLPERQPDRRRQGHELGLQAQEHGARSPHLHLLPGPHDVQPPGPGKYQDHPHCRRPQLLAHLRAKRPADRDHPAELRFLHQTRRKRRHAAGDALRQAPQLQAHPGERHQVAPLLCRGGRPR